MRVMLVRAGCDTGNIQPRRDKTQKRALSERIKCIREKKAKQIHVLTPLGGSNTGAHDLINEQEL